MSYWLGWQDLNIERALIITQPYSTFLLCFQNGQTCGFRCLILRVPPCQLHQETRPLSTPEQRGNYSLDFVPCPASECCECVRPNIDQFRYQKVIDCVAVRPANQQKKTCFPICVLLALCAHQLVGVILRNHWNLCLFSLAVISSHFTSWHLVVPFFTVSVSMFNCYRFSFLENFIISFAVLDLFLSFSLSIINRSNFFAERQRS